MRQQPKITYYSPLPPEETGIADYSADLLPYLEQHFDIQLGNKKSMGDSARLAVYQMGNSPFHNWIYDALKERPGIVVLHDWVLAQFMGQRPDFGREVTYALGAEQGRAVLFGETPLRDPVNRRVLDLALGLIVHSEYVATLARREHPNLPVVVAPMPMAVAGAARQLKEHVTFGLVGQVARNKQIERCLRIFGRYHAAHPNAQLSIIGGTIDFDLQPIIENLPPTLRKAITWHGYLPYPHDFRAALDQIDIVFNLRHPTVGETSAAALRALAQGKPIIVNDVGWYRELPDAVALKVTAQDDAQLLAAMVACVANYTDMSSAAIAYIHDGHKPEKAVAKYLTLIDLVRSKTNF